MSLGDLTVRINADTSGFTAGAQAVADGIRETQQTAAQASRSLASQAASLAATYRRQGMNMSDAMRRAWSEIERNSPQQRRGSHSGNNGAGGFFSGARDELSETNSLLARSRSGISALSSGIKSLAKTAAALAGVTLGVAGLVQAFKSYVSLESSVLRVNDLFKESAKYIEYFAAVTGKSLGMAESSAYEFAATYGNLFKNITKDTAENAKVTIAMLKASAVVASKTGRTMEDVMERIRSGLLGNTEAIEDLGINVNVAMLEVTDAFKQISNGRSWEQLTFYEQQQIRTLAILEQADKNFGNEVQTGSAYSLSVLSGAFKDLMSTAGAFINKAWATIRGMRDSDKIIAELEAVGIMSLSEFGGFMHNIHSPEDHTDEVVELKAQYTAIDKLLAMMKQRSDNSATYKEYQERSAFTQKHFRKKNAAAIDAYEEADKYITEHIKAYYVDGKAPKRSELAALSKQLKDKRKAIMPEHKAYLLKHDMAFRYTRQVRQYLNEQYMKREREKSRQRTQAKHRNKNTLE